MRVYDAFCPVCGHRNNGLYLEETDGYLECENCGTIARGILCGEESGYPARTLRYRHDVLPVSGYSAGSAS